MQSNTAAQRSILNLPKFGDTPPLLGQLLVDNIQQLALHLLQAAIGTNLHPGLIFQLLIILPHSPLELCNLIPKREEIVINWQVEYATNLITLSYLSSPKPPRCFATSSVTSMNTTRSGLRHRIISLQSLVENSPGQPNIRLFAPVEAQPWFGSWERYTAVSIPGSHWQVSNAETGKQTTCLWLCLSLLPNSFESASLSPTCVRDINFARHLKSIILWPIGREEEVDGSVIKFFTASQVRVDDGPDASTSVREPGVYPVQHKMFGDNSFLPHHFSRTAGLV